MEGQLRHAPSSFMASQGGPSRINSNPSLLTLQPSDGLTAVTVLVVTVVAWCLVVAGKLDSAYSISIPVIACLAGLLGAQAPRITLRWLFCSAPLLWALGDTKVFQSDTVHVNLPMLVGFMVVISFCHVLLVKDPDPGIERIRMLVIGMGVACVPAIFFAQDFFTGAGTYLRVMCPYIVMFATLRHVHEKSDVLYYARSMVFALFAVAIVLVIGYWRSELWIEYGGYGRLGALYFQPQAFGVYLSIMVFIVMLNYLLTRKLGYLLLLPFPLIVLFLTYFRTAWIGATVLVVLLTFQIKKSYGRGLLLIASFVGVIFFSTFWQSILRYATVVDSLELADKVFSGRLAVDVIAFQNYLDAPLLNKIFGIGFFRTGEATALVYGEEVFIHNDFLGFLIEVGVFALLFYLAILVALLKRSRQGKCHIGEGVSHDLCAAVFILIVAVMVMGIPGAFYTQVLSNFYIYGVMGLMLSQTRLSQQHNRNGEGIASVAARAVSS